MTLTVRPLDLRDSLEDLTALLHRAYARLGAMGLNFTAVDQSVAVTRERAQSGHCLVAELDGAIVGTVVVQAVFPGDDCAYYMRPGVAVVQQFAVDPSAQGKGVGRALLSACEAWAAEHGAREIALDTAEPAAHLVALYARAGYSAVAHVQWQGKRYRSVILSKRLGAH